ncbi:OLC1v1004162C1 [Oldenlandia corymbosa var. corymbosa]|uniref:OLC1v1004162C1 n=1 Tax=Oldenlandia corymbosa var. corymbosa TaxID=529605 RepID=A0AAV1DBM4_OLDCO|nr:OLC1v1004162C1 [Oldenlandia corymbosa var. corymbosa]
MTYARSKQGADEKTVAESMGIKESSRSDPLSLKDDNVTDFIEAINLEEGAVDPPDEHYTGTQGATPEERLDQFTKFKKEPTESGTQKPVESTSAQKENPEEPGSKQSDGKSSEKGVHKEPVRKGLAKALKYVRERGWLQDEEEEIRGRKMREKFRTFWYKFHGKGEGFKKKGNRRLRNQADLKSNYGDSQIRSAENLTKLLLEHKSPHLVLSKKQRNPAISALPVNLTPMLGDKKTVFFGRF